MKQSVIFPAHLRQFVQHVEFMKRLIYALDSFSQKLLLQEASDSEVASIIASAYEYLLGSINDVGYLDRYMEFFRSIATSRNMKSARNKLLKMTPYQASGLRRLLLMINSEAAKIFDILETKEEVITRGTFKS
jgi:hypothetical protein